MLDDGQTTPRSVIPLAGLWRRVARRMSARSAHHERHNHAAGLAAADRRLLLEPPQQPAHREQLGALRRKLEQDVLRASQVERRRIGQDLHDTVVQDVVAAAFLARALAKALAGRRAPEHADVAQIEQLLNHAIAQARAIARGLCPAPPHEAGLGPAIMALASTMERVYGVSCTLSYDEGADLADAAAAEQLYHIVHEALSNAMRHGRARNVRIAVSDGDRTIRLTVRDDGVGLPEHVDENQGMGLRIMRQRAETIGASLAVGPHPDGGTVVECLLPKPVAES